MNYKLYVPANLDLEALIEDRINNYPVKYQKGVSSENLAYILHCIIKRSIQYKEKIYEGEWDGYEHNLSNILSQYSRSIKFLHKLRVLSIKIILALLITIIGLDLCIQIITTNTKKYAQI